MKKLFLQILLILGCMQPFVANAEGIAAFGDILVWRASEEPAATWASVVNVTGTRNVKVTAENIPFEWDLGFRGGFIYDSSNNKWQNRLYWTFFTTTNNTGIHLGEQLVVPEFFSGFLSQNYFLGANLDWRLVMNIIDYELAHSFRVHNMLAITPRIGIKGGTINQSINSQWDAILFVATENLKNNFFGIGPSFGLDTTWSLFKNFNLIGNFTTAFMWGNWRISDVYSRPAALLVSPTVISTNFNNSQLGVLMLQYILGLEWVYTGRSQVTLQLGYEMQYWANQLKIPTFQQLPVHGDLTLQGGTCRILIDF
jgi:hypothetical protein